MIIPPAPSETAETWSWSLGDVDTGAPWGGHWACADVAEREVRMTAKRVIRTRGDMASLLGREWVRMWMKIAEGGRRFTAQVVRTSDAANLVYVCKSFKRLGGIQLPGRFSLVRRGHDRAGEGAQAVPVVTVNFTPR
jgi:hypothetical protein